MVERSVGLLGLGVLQPIQKLRKPLWIVQKQPANHCLKPCGESISCRVGSLGSTPCPIAAATHQIPLLLAQQGIKLSKGLSLSLSTDPGNNSTMKNISATG